MTDMNIKYLDLTKITQSFEPELSHRIQSVVRSGWFLLGEETRVFEKSFANRQRPGCAEDYPHGIQTNLPMER